MSYNVTALFLFFTAMAVLFVMRRRLGLFTSSVAFFVVTMLYVMYGLDPPTPASVVKIYAAFAVVAFLLYVTSSEASRRAFLGPIQAVMVEPRLRPVLLLSLVVIPGVVAWQVYQASLPSQDPPPRVRSVHPSPPSTINISPLQGEARSIDLIKDDSPYVDLKESDPQAYAEKVERGWVVYYQNCYYCHGDNLAADGHYAAALKPPPANFQDPGVIPMLENAFLFWRIAKGGPGLPSSGTPWDSAMPAWEKFLSEDDMWAVILFMSEFTGYNPRVKENLAEAH